MSGHATDVGRFFYGDLSMAPGIMTVNAYRADGTLGLGDSVGLAYLRVGTNLNPRTSLGRVQNHSYIGNIGTGSADPLNAEALLRLDYAIKRDNIVSVVAVANDGGDAARGFTVVAYEVTDGMRKQVHLELEGLPNDGFGVVDELAGGETLFFKGAIVVFDGPDLSGREFVVEVDSCFGKPGPCQVDESDEKDNDSNAIRFPDVD